MNAKIVVAGVTVALPDGWFDVTEDLPVGSPTTLAKPDGIGALQFSIARYQAGAPPNIDASALRGLLMEFGDDQGLGAPSPMYEGGNKNLLVQGDFEPNGELVRVWYVSNSRDVALITYTTQQPWDSKAHDELQDVNSIVDSLDF